MTGLSTIDVRAPTTIRSGPGRETVLVFGGRQSANRGDPAIAKALARAFPWKRMQDDGKSGSISEVLEADQLDRSNAGSILRFTLLAPDSVQGIVAGVMADRASGSLTGSSMPDLHMLPVMPGMPGPWLGAPWPRRRWALPSRVCW